MIAEGRCPSGPMQQRSGDEDAQPHISRRLRPGGYIGFAEAFKKTRWETRAIVPDRYEDYFGIPSDLDPYCLLYTSDAADE